VKPYLQDSDLTIYQGDALEVLRELPDESVDCCVTSPPYLDARSEYPSPTIPEFSDIFHELGRVVTGPFLLDVGRMWFKGVERMWWWYLLEVAADSGWRLRDTRIWCKPNANPIHGAVFVDSHEYVFVLMRSGCGCRLNEDALRRPHSAETIARHKRAWKSHRGVKGEVAERSTRVPLNPLGARPRSYFEAQVGGEKGNKHPAPMPLEVAQELVTLASFPGQIVIDPFGGSGTTAVACRALGRSTILIDRDPDYCAMAAKRLSQLSLLAEER
jgi:site-specific DNA-methyltransferase (adenine-specific)